MEPEEDFLPTPADFSVLLLGATGQGKTSVALELTNKKKTFLPKSGKKIQTSQIIYDCSDPEFVKKNNANFHVFDTIGYFSDEKNPIKILEDILDSIYMNSQHENLDAVILVMRLGERAIEMKKMRENLRKIGVVEEENGKLTNCIVLLTFTDVIYENESQDEEKFSIIVDEDREYFKEHVDDASKIILWVSPPSEKKRQNVLNTNTLNKIYSSQYGELIKAIPKCKKIKFSLIHKYRDILRMLLIKRFDKIFEKTIKEDEKEPFELAYSLNFRLKFNSEGFLADDLEKFLNIKMINQNISNIIYRGLISTTLGLSAALITKKISPLVIFPSVGILTDFVMRLINNRKKEFVINTSSKLERGLLNNCSDFSGLFHQFFFEKKMHELPLFHYDFPDKKKMIITINAESKEKMIKIFKDYFIFQNANTGNNFIQVNVINNNNEIVLEWNSENCKNKQFGVKLDVLLRMNIPKKEIIEQELETIIEEKKKEVWDRLKTTGNYCLNN